MDEPNIQVSLEQDYYGDFYIQLGGKHSTILEMRDEISRLWEMDAITADEAGQLFHELEVECLT